MTAAAAASAAAAAAAATPAAAAAAIDGGVMFELFDCRPRVAYVAGHVPGSHHLDPKNLGTPQVQPQYNGPYGDMSRIVQELVYQVCSPRETISE